MFLPVSYRLGGVGGTIFVGFHIPNRTFVVVLDLNEEQGGKFRVCFPLVVFE